MGETEAAEIIEQSHDVTSKGGISGKKLMKIGKFYLKHHPDLATKQEEEEEEEETVAKKSSKAKPSTSVNSKRRPSKETQEEEEEQPKASKKKVKAENSTTKSSRKSSKVEDEEEEDLGETKKAQKNKAAKKVKKAVEADESDEEESEKQVKQKKASKTSKKVVDDDEEEDEDEKPTQKKDKDLGLKEKSAANGSLNFNKTTSYDEQSEESPKKNDGHRNNRFSYVDQSIITGVADHLTDNTFESKAKYGNEGDTFGQFGHERLIITQGKGFKKEKSKLKNKQFHGGGGKINPNVVNSTKLSYDD